jgi:tetratricopeptide (TPR) repeat protein
VFLTLAVRFAFWALFGILVLVALSLLLIDMRFVDWVATSVIGATTDIRSRTGVSHLSEVVKAHKDEIDLAIKVVGLAFTIIIGTLTFLAGWYYAAFNLPLRLVEYLTHLRTAHLHNRAVALSPYFSRNLRGDATPVSRGYLSRALSIFAPNFFRVRAIYRSLENAEAIDADVGVLNESLRETKSRRITIHLVNGLKLAASARSMEPGSLQLERNEAAMEEFRKALELEPRDLEALEAAAKQCKVLNLNAEALGYLETMVEAAANEAPIRHARALRYQAELLEERSTRTALNAARINLDAALALLALQNGDDAEPVANG